MLAILCYGVLPAADDQRPHAHLFKTVRHIIQQVVHLVSVITLIQNAPVGELPGSDVMEA